MDMSRRGFVCAVAFGLALVLGATGWVEAPPGGAPRSVTVYSWAAAVTEADRNRREQGEHLHEGGARGAA